MSRPDPLFLLTLLGLTGCGLLAVVHPSAPFDPGDPAAQTGRSVAIRLEVLTSDVRDGWARGLAAPTDAPDAQIAWVWFRPPEPGPLPGDRVIGRALVEQKAEGVGLVLDGSAAAVVLPGPVPVPVRWSELAAQPERYMGRLLVINGQIDGTALVAPDGARRCVLDEPVAPIEAPRFLVRLARSADGFGWACRVEGPAL